MIRAGCGLSTRQDAAAAATEAVEQALGAAGLRAAEAVLCFIGSRYAGAYPAMVRTLCDRAATRNVVGCSASGVVGRGREIEGGAAVAVLVLGGGGLSARRLFVPGLKRRPDAAARELAAGLRPNPGTNHLLCLFPDTYNLAPEPFLTALEREMPGVMTVGGGASETGFTGETSVFCADAVGSDALSALLLSGDFEVAAGASLGCRLLGQPLRVTAARDNLLLELDGQPALTVFEQVVGPLASDLRRAAAMVYLARAFAPKSERLEPGGYLIRNLAGFEPRSKALATATPLTPGDLVGFALRSPEGARDNLKASLDALAGQLSGPPEVGLYFDCVARGSSLYAMADHDSAYIARAFPELPVAGFCCGFELGPMAGQTRLLQYSGVLALLKDRNP